MKLSEMTGPLVCVYCLHTPRPLCYISPLFPSSYPDHLLRHSLLLSLIAVCLSRDERITCLQRHECSAPSDFSVSIFFSFNLETFFSSCPPITTTTPTQ